jgi:hypothetical protein
MSATFNVRNTTAETQDSLWRQFGAASSEKAFCTAWLKIQCHMMQGVAAGIVLLGAPEEDRP